MKLTIRETDEPFPNTDKSWFFLENEESNYDFRWVIGYRKRGDWWGVIASFPATHEGAIDRIAEEMKLAKQAIQQLKTKQLK